MTKIVRRLEGTDDFGLAVSGVQLETDSEHTERLSVKRDA